MNCQSATAQWEVTGPGWKPIGRQINDHEITIWVNYNELTTSEPWKSWLGFGESSPFMALIQISELL